MAKRKLSRRNFFGATAGMAAATAALSDPPLAAA